MYMYQNIFSGYLWMEILLSSLYIVFQIVYNVLLLIF